MQCRVWDWGTDPAAVPVLPVGTSTGCEDVAVDGCENRIFVAWDNHNSSPPGHVWVATSTDLGATWSHVDVAEGNDPSLFAKPGTNGQVFLGFQRRQRAPNTVKPSLLEVVIMQRVDAGAAFAYPGAVVGKNGVLGAGRFAARRRIPARERLSGRGL